MRRSWTTLSTQIKTEAEWYRLWGAVITALHLAKRLHASKAKIRDEYLRINDAALKLARAIENRALDLLVYEFAPDDAMKINGVSGWCQLDSLQRAYAAGKLLREWPSLTEILYGLSERAKLVAAQAMSAPTAVQRRSRDSKMRVLVLALVEHLTLKLGHPHYGTVAAIVSVTLDFEITKSMVAKIASRKKG